jgi:hypothetical protein
LHERLGSKIIGAPEIQFVQSEGKDLCVTKSLASAFFALEWHNAASKIDAFGEDILKGAAVNALRRVIKHKKASSLLGSSFDNFQPISIGKMTLKTARLWWECCLLLMTAVHMLLLSMVTLSLMQMRKLHCICAKKPWIVALLQKWSKVNLFHSNLDIDSFMEERGHCNVQK